MASPQREPEQQAPGETKPWHSQYPAPKNINPEAIQPKELREMLELINGMEKTVLIDLRKNDHVGGTIRGSINLPAQSLYPSIPTLYSVFSKAQTENVIWYCGSSRGRGTRAAGWFADYCLELGDMRMKSLILDGGIKRWVSMGGEYAALIDGYVEDCWQFEEL